MGVRFFNVSNSCFSSPQENPQPDPAKFKIEREERIHGFVLVEVSYPDCTTFEGRKILLFRGVSILQIINHNGGKLDPHFSDAKGFISPVARFEPTTAGWNMAKDVMVRAGMV